MSQRVCSNCSSTELSVYAQDAHGLVVWVCESCGAKLDELLLTVHLIPLATAAVAVGAAQAD